MSNFKILKNGFCVILCLCVVLSLSCCAKSGEGLKLNGVVEKILTENGIEKSKITFLCESSEKISKLYDYTESEITNEELTKYVDDLLISHEKMIEITDRKIVENGDAVVVSYVVYYDDEIVANTVNEPLMVGSGNYDQNFEKVIIGAVVGEPFVCELNSPVDTDKYQEGDLLRYNITVNSINYFEKYTSSDRYILDYYGCDTEEDFLNECKNRLEQIKKYEALNTAYDDFLEKISEKCKFYIDEDEAADYSRKIVEDYKNSAYLLNLSLEEFIEQKLCITEDDFYDRCYDEGVAEIKRYLLVGASTTDVDINAAADFDEYCSLNGYDAADTDNTSGKYYYLKRITVLNNRPDVKFVVTAEAYVPYFEEDCEYTVDIYDTSNIYSVNLKSDTKRDLSGDEQDRIIAQLKETSFGGSQYNATNQLYQTVLVVKKDGKVTEKIYVDTLNGYLKWQPSNEKTVICKLTPEFEDLIKNSN